MTCCFVNYAVLLCCLFLVVASETSTERYVEISGELQQEILDNLINDENGYDPRVPPQGKNGLEESPVEVRSSMYILDISHVDDFNMDFTMQFYFRQVWNDPRLQFDGVSDQVKKINVKDFDKIWKPDLFFVEEREGKQHSIMLPNSFMKISPNGDVQYSVRLSMTSRCGMDLRYFPMDTQKCVFTIESYGYTTKDIKLTWAAHVTPVTKSDAIELYDFNINDVIASEDVAKFHFGEYTRLKLELTFTRKLGFFMTKLYVPFMALVFVSWLSFWIKPKFVAQRMSLLLSILFIMLALASDINSYIPPASYTKGIDVWTAFCLSLVFGSLLEFIFVSQLSKEEHKKEKQRARNDPESAAPIGGLKNGEKTEALLDEDQVHSASKLVARNLYQIVQWSHRADSISRYLFPVLFGAFNVIYWSVYGPGNWLPSF